MSDYNRFSEHYRIDHYLRKKSSFGVKTISVNRNDNILSNFPIGLIIISKEELKFEDKLDFINQHACRLFGVKETINLKELKEKLSEFVKLKNSNKATASQTLCDIIFNNSSFNIELENFIPFESPYSKNVILYIKINEVGDEKYIVVDKYDKYIEERKYIELNLIKTINYQYLHTLYHELNNPLNALLSLSGDSGQYISSDISNSRIENRSAILPKKTVKQKKRSNNNLHNNNNYRKKKNSELISISKLTSNQDFFDYKTRKKTLNDNYDSDLNEKITLLINIIKIFIKNFILYLKTRADNLLMIKNEYNTQSETSDIMNAVEVSEYEKELTQHKLIKINLEYIFNLYFEKFLCLFKYKEIECDTNFEKLKNLYVVTDEFNFIYYIRQIYTYLYYIVPKKEGFIFDYIEEPNDMIKIIIKKKNVTILKKETSDEEITIISKNKIDNVKQVIQTKEMTKEVLYSMTKRLNFTLDINDNECMDKNNNNDIYYLCLTIPVQKKNKAEEEDDFKDEDINEMIQNETTILEDKLKRQFPNNNNEQKSIINTSANNICDILNKSEDERKDNSDSFLSLQKKETNKKSSNNNIKDFKKKISDNNISSNISNIYSENQKKNFLLNNNNDNNFLNKCLKYSENKSLDINSKEKEKHRHKSYNYLKVSNGNQNIKHCSDKNVLYNNLGKNFAKENKSQNPKFSGVFTKINKFGCSEELDCNDLSISNNLEENQNEKEEIHNNNNQNILLKNNNLNNQINLELCSGTQNSTNFLSSINGLKNSKLKSGYDISEIIGGGENHNKNINININNNNIINIIHDKNIREFNLNDFKNQKLSCFNEKKEGGGGEITDDKKKGSSQTNNILGFSPEIKKKKPKRFSQNMSPQIRNKDCMTFFNGDKKDDMSKGKKTIYNDNINENDKLFLEANNEREMCLKKSRKNIFPEDCIPDSQFDEEDEEEEEEDDDEEEEEDNVEQEEEKPKCDCKDILIVDDEKFNVMAAQRMMKNLGCESDAAYNGEECINLIKEKQKLNCQCNKNYYKLIFLDIVMPVLDGISTAKKVQEMIDNKEINENIKIIFISGNIDGEKLKNSLLQMDCVKECLQKPVRIDKYQKIIEKYYK